MDVKTIRSRHGIEFSLVLALLFAVGLSAPAHGAGRQDPGVITLASDVRKGPNPGDVVVATVPAGHRVTVLEMSGAGARIRSAKVNGWVPAAKVRIGDSPSGQASSSQGGSDFFRGVASLLGGGGKKTRDVKVTAGARGLTPGSLEGATADPAARQRMERQQVSRAEAEKFARRGKLVARNYAYLPTGYAAASGSSSSARSGSDSGAGAAIGGFLQGLKGVASGAGSAPATATPDR